MAFCPNCGNQVEDGSKFCPSCGNSINAPASNNNTNSQQSGGSSGSLFGELKKGGLNFKKGMDDLAHGEYKNFEKPEGALYFINGKQGTLAVYDEYIELNFSGSTFKKLQSGFGGVKKIYYHQINSIQKRDATDMINGSIEFELPGMAASTFSKNENLITYLPKYQEEVNKICEFVENKILEIHQTQSQPQTQVVQNEVSPMAKLKEAKELLDMGVISQEEFDEIKSKCLANM